MADADEIFLAQGGADHVDHDRPRRKPYFSHLLRTRSHHDPIGSVRADDAEPCGGGLMLPRGRRSANPRWKGIRMEQRMVLMAAVLLVTLAVLFPPAYSMESDLLMAALFVIALVCSLGRIYVSHSRM